MAAIECCWHLLATCLIAWTCAARHSGISDLVVDCDIYKNGTYVNCSFRNLMDVPKGIIPPTVTHLDLHNNSISKLGNNTFSNFIRLQFLDLSNNNISEMEELAFSELVNLRSLNLSDNRLVMNNSTFHDQVFDPLSGLEELKLNKNNPKCDESEYLQYPDTALSRLTNLRALYMDGLQNRTFGAGFLNLTLLTNLSLAGYKNGCCRMSSLNNETFQFMPRLVSLNISNCYIRGVYLQPGMFSNLKNLVSLDMNHNEDIDIDHVDTIFSSLSNISTLRILHMQLIVNRYSIGICLDSSYIRNIPQQLEEFYAQENNLEGVDRHVIKQLAPSLKVLDVSGNRFVFGTYLQDLHRMGNLTRLVLNGGGFTYKLPNLYPFQLKLFGPPSNCTLYAEKGLNVGNYTPFQLILPPNLESVEMENAGLTYMLSALTVHPNNKLQYLSMKGNKFPQLIGPFVGLNSLRHLDLSNSYVHIISDVFFTNLTSLITLKLESNLLGDFFASGDDLRVFSPLANLQLLNLSFNDIRNLSENIFFGLDNLQTLILKKNSLEVFSVNISHMHNLSYIDLDRNRITRLPVLVQEQIDLLVRGGVGVQLIMTWCPISCKCDNQDFLQWVTRSRSFVNDSPDSKYLCEYDDSQRYITDGYNSTVRYLMRNCSHNTVLFFCVVAAIFLVFFLILCSILYRFRWNIRYLYYAAHIFYRPKNEEKHNSKFKYDAFISYDHQDDHIVLHKMTPELEKRGLKLCIHGRDFLAGEYIASNIVRAVCASRRTLVVLTRRLADSYWCRFEVQMANMESVHKNRKVLLFLVMEHIPSKVLGMEMLYHIRNNTYIPYPETLPDATSMGRFWDKLASDIRR